MTPVPVRGMDVRGCLMPQAGHSADVNGSASATYQQHLAAIAQPAAAAAAGPESRGSIRDAQAAGTAAAEIANARPRWVQAGQGRPADPVGASWSGQTS